MPIELRPLQNQGKMATAIAKLCPDKKLAQHKRGNNEHTVFLYRHTPGDSGHAGISPAFLSANTKLEVSMRKLHLALAVSNIEQSVADYSARLGALPVSSVPGEYALWRTETLNLSIRQTSEPSGTLRHLGWEDTEATEFSTEIDCNSIVWEKFSASHQAQEINEIWPSANYQPAKNL